MPSKPVITIIDKERRQTTYNLGWTVPAATDADFLPLTLAQKMLGSRMFFRFVYEEGICYRMWTRITENIGPGKFWFETGISPENYRFSQREVLKEFNDFFHNIITDEMLEDAKSECRQTQIIENETAAARAKYIAKHYLMGLGPDYIFRYPNLVNSLTARDVKRAVNRYLSPDNYTLLVVGKTE